MTKTNCPSSAVIAQDILAAPAGQAFVERGFLCAACLLLVWNWTKKYWRT